MSWGIALVLGFVQGLTEFLPISSSAHMRVVAALAGWPDPGKPIELRVSTSFFATVRSGSWVIVSTGPGFLGWEWMRGIRQHPSAP